LKNDPAVETLGRIQRLPPPACHFATSTLLVLAGNDTLAGGAGNDTLIGGAGNGVLTGGGGTDRFAFDMSLGNSAFDTIKDFVTGTGKILLLVKVFGKFAGSSAVIEITAGNLVVGAGATAKAIDANDYLIDGTTSDLLCYDDDCPLGGVSELE